MGSVTVREAMRQWSVLLQDSDPQFARHTESEAVDWFNDAQLAICTYLPSACAGVYTIRLQAGSMHNIESIAAADVKLLDGSAAIEDLRCAMFNDMLVNMGAAGTAPGRAIRPLTDGREVLDGLSPNWHAQTDATEVLNFLYDPRAPKFVMTYPPVPTGRLWVRTSVVAQLKRIPNVGETGYASYAASGSNGLTLSIADEHVPDLVHYACARALMKDAEASSSTGMSARDFTQLFAVSINSKSEALLGSNPNLKRLPFAPELPGAAS